MHHVGLLAFGSLISTPGRELKDATSHRITDVPTPFRVEYARHSLVRGGAPTLVPVTHGGSSVSGVILVMTDGVTLADARHRTYRRERNEVGSELRYRHLETPDPNDAHLPILGPLGDVETVFYVVLGDTIPERDRVPETLARKAIASVGRTEVGRDGISYLRDNIASCIETPLTEPYRQAVLSETRTKTLDDALETVRSLI